MIGTRTLQSTNSWAITEPSIGYQAQYIRVLARYVRRGNRRDVPKTYAQSISELDIDALIDVFMNEPALQKNGQQSRTPLTSLMSNA